MRKKRKLTEHRLQEIMGGMAIPEVTGTGKNKKVRAGDAANQFAPVTSAQLEGLANAVLLSLFVLLPPEKNEKAYGELKKVLDKLPSDPLFPLNRRYTLWYAYKLLRMAEDARPDVRSS